MKKYLPVWNGIVKIQYLCGWIYTELNVGLILDYEQ